MAGGVADWLCQLISLVMSAVTVSGRAVHPIGLVKTRPLQIGHDATRRTRYVPDGGVARGDSRSMAEHPRCMLTCGKPGQVRLLHSFPS